MQIIGNLVNDKIIIKKQKDSGKLYSRSHFGTLHNHNIVYLDLIEAVFLVGEKKLIVYKDKKELDFKTLFLHASKHIAEFEIKYLIYKDLRSRGRALQLNSSKKYNLFSLKKKTKQHNEKTTLIYGFSERDLFSISKTIDLVHKSRQENTQIWYAIVDEEGDITYYLVCIQEMKGTVEQHNYPKVEATILKNRVVLFDKKVAKSLFDKEFYGKPLSDGLQISLVEGLYLQNKKVIDLISVENEIYSDTALNLTITSLQPDINQRLVVFSDLKQKGLIVKTGFKFGVHFRAYTKQPNRTHAEYLVHVISKEFTSIWAEMSRAVRLAHSVNKEIVFAQVIHKKIIYIKFGRLRP
jgi:tRNA-intron endonuclease, archaea type